MTKTQHTVRSGLRLTLLAAALLAAGAASAAQVSISGAIDNSIQVMKAKGSPTKVTQEPDQFYSTGVHFDASEDLGNGYGIESKLWIVASADSGEIASPDGALFNHTLLAVKTPYGKFGAGRFGAFGSGFGPIGEWWKADPFCNGLGDAGPQATQTGIYGELLRNSLFYMSPEMKGFKVGLLYSLTEESNTEGAAFRDDTKLWEVFGSYHAGPALLMADVQGNHYGHASAYRQLGDRFRAKFAGAYELGDVTLYGGYAYGRNEIRFNTTAWGNRPDFKFDPLNAQKDGANGRTLDMHSVYLGVKKTMGALDLMAMGQAQWGENKGQNAESSADPKFTRYVGSLGAFYNFSPCTMLYTAATFGFVGKGWKENQARSLERRMFIAGIGHRF